MQTITDTPESLRAEAQKCRQEAADSFERCDTDGFLSQWASGLSAQKKNLQANILENGGKASFWGLYTVDGQRVAAKMIDGQFGLVWLLREDSVARFGRKFVPVNCEGRSRVRKALGLVELEEWAPARACIKGRGYGLSGTARACTERTGDEWGLDSTTN